MAIALSDANLKEIYSLSNEDKLDLVDMIIKSMRSAATRLKVKSAEPSVSWVSQFEGKWEDSKSADEMVMDLRRSRTSNGMIMVTDNVKHFSRIEGIQLENWVRR